MSVQEQSVQEQSVPTSKAYKVYIETFGCQMNEYDTDKILEILKKENYSYTDTTDEADLVLLNTCSVREKAEQKVYSLLGRLRPLKARNPNLIIGVGGCVAQQEGKAILDRDRSVDLVFGTDNLTEVPQLLERVRRGERVLQTARHASKEKVRNFIPDFAFETVSTPGIKAHIAITKGCDKFCTFCIVPITRGREVSREPENILEEARHLVSQGTKEICLLGQNVNSYRTQGIDFVDLLYRMDEITGLERIRFTSPHPRDFKEPLAIAIRDLRTVCEQIHLPLQSGSSRILDAMKRHYTIETYLEKVDMLRHYLPQGSVSTDMIVGFPGETDEDFQMTMDAIKRVKYDQVYAFKYSPRPETPAASFADQVPNEVKVERLRILLEVQEAILNEKQQQMIGSLQEVLVEGEHPKNPEDKVGRSRGNHSVAIRQSNHQKGDLVKVRIMKARKYSFESEAIA